MKRIYSMLSICLLSSMLYAHSEKEEMSTDSFFCESQLIQPECRAKRGNNGKQNKRRIRNKPNHTTNLFAQAALNNPTATIQTLQIKDVSVSYFQNNPNIFIPIGLSAPSFNPEQTPSEAFGYAIRNAVEYDDPQFFMNLVTGFLYFANQTEIKRNQLKGADSNLAWGLMGFTPNYKTGLYSDNISDLSSASDADEDILNGLIKAYGFIYGPNPKSNWRNLLQNNLFQDNINPLTLGPCMDNPQKTDCQLVFKSVDLKSMIQMMIDSFAFKNKGLGDPKGFRDLGKPTSGNYPQPAQYMLSLDNYGHDPVNPDYFDPQFFNDLLQSPFVKQGSDEYNNLLKAGQNTMDAIAGLAAKYQNWIPDNPYQEGNPGNFGFDAVRILMRLGQYIASSDKDLLERRDVATKVLKALVQNISSNIFRNQTVDQASKFAQGAGGNGLQGGCFTGPWLLALKALKKNKELPQNIKDYKGPNNTKYIDNVTDAFRIDLTKYDDSSANAWQHDGYFNIQLALLCQGIMNDLGL